jgi:hypothetical protein
MFEADIVDRKACQAGQAADSGQNIIQEAPIS